jgi:predicted GIY-YIG superfamily endonuclease
MKIIKKLPHSSIEGGYLYLPVELNPKEILPLGELISVLDVQKNKVYSKVWSDSGNRYFLYGMKEIYNANKLNSASNVEIELYWSDKDKTLCLDIRKNKKSLDDTPNSNSIDTISPLLYSGKNVVAKLISREEYKEQRDMLNQMPSMYILLNKLSSSSKYYVGYSLNMYQRLNTHNSRPPYSFNWTKAIVFVHKDGSALFVEEAMRLEYKALNNIRNDSSRLVNRKRSIHFNYTPETINKTEIMFQEIKHIINEELNLKIFQRK